MLFQHLMDDRWRHGKPHVRCVPAPPERTSRLIWEWHPGAGGTPGTKPPARTSQWRAEA
jgi:hypothetical protein